MLKRKGVFVLIFILAIILSSGCNIFKRPKTEEVKLELSGFPYEHETYYLEVYTILNGSDPVKIKTTPGVNSPQPHNETLTVDVTTSELVVYLFTGPGQEKPVYFTTIPYDPEVKSYTAMYWLDYLSHAEGIQKFGISSMFVRTVENGISEDLDFQTTPYYLYQVNGAQNNSLTIRLTMTQGHVNYSYGDSVSTGEISTYTGQKVTSLRNYQEEELYILLTAGSYTQPVRGKITIEIHQQVPINGTITDMAAGGQPDRMYAAARQTGTTGDIYKLYYINPVEKQIDEEFTLPAALNPTAIAYSGLTEKLYILSSSVGTVGIWDPTTGTVATYQYGTGKGRDLAVDALNRYMYITSTTGLYIVDLDDPTVVLASYSTLDYLSTIELDIVNKQMLAMDSLYSQVYRFALSGTQVTEKQKIKLPIVFGSKIVLGPEKRKLYYLNDTTKSIVCLEVSNFLNKLGSWQLDYAPDDLTISPDGSILYAVDGGTVGVGASNSLYLFNEHSPQYGIIRKFPFPNTAKTALLTVNNEGSALAGYSREYDPVTKLTNSTIVFYTNIQLNSSITANWQSYQLPLAGNNYAIF